MSLYGCGDYALGRFWVIEGSELLAKGFAIRATMIGGTDAPWTRTRCEAGNAGVEGAGLLTSLRTGGLHRRYARRDPELVERWGPEAAAKYDRVGTLYSVGFLGTVSMLLVFMASSAAGWDGIAVAALAVAFLVLVPLMFVAAAIMSSVTKQICRRYDIDPHSKPPLSFKALKNAGSFDRWLAAHGRQPPPAGPFGTGRGTVSR